MAKTFITRKSGPGPTSPGGTFLMQMMVREKRRALSIVWPTLPDRPRSVRLRIQPQPRPDGLPIQPVAFCDFQISE